MRIRRRSRRSYPCPLVFLLLLRVVRTLLGSLPRSQGLRGSTHSFRRKREPDLPELAVFQLDADRLLRIALELRGHLVVTARQLAESERRLALELAVHLHPDSRRLRKDPQRIDRRRQIDL